MMPHAADPAPDTPTPPPHGRPHWLASSTALRGALTPAWVARGTYRLGFGLLATVALAVLLPWQQSAPGYGTVTALDPSARPQDVQAPTTGRVVRWHVQEGDTVEAGALLVELRDNDPYLQDRLAEEASLTDQQVTAARDKVRAARDKQSAADAARQAALDAASAKRQSAEDKHRAEREVLTAAEAALGTASIQQARAEDLAAEGLRSVQDVETAVLRTETARAKRDESRAKVDAARAEAEAARGELEKARTDADAKIASAAADLALAEADLAAYEAKRLAVATKVARQENQQVTAPVSGRVVRTAGGFGSEQIKAGDLVVQIVPESAARVVAMHVDGNDIRFVRMGDPVRVVFEGWPAVQVAGWPGVAVGTFGGRVRSIDPVDNGEGNFRVLVDPDPDQPAWPDATLLRQGLKAHAWVLLGQVPIGYELWRQLNDFPPSRAPETEKKSASELSPVERPKTGRAWTK